MIDTDDLVQDTVINTLKHIDVFEYRADSALQEALFAVQPDHYAVRNNLRTTYRLLPRTGCGLDEPATG